MLRRTKLTDPTILPAETVLAAIDEVGCDTDRLFKLDGILKLAAIDYVEGWTKRSFIGSEFEWIGNFSGCLEAKLLLPRTPVVAISAFQERNGINEAWTDIAATRYELIGDEIHSCEYCCCKSGRTKGMPWFLCCNKCNQFRIQWTTGVDHEGCLPNAFVLAVSLLIQHWDHDPDAEIPRGIYRLMNQIRTVHAY